MGVCYPYRGPRLSSGLRVLTWHSPDCCKHLRNELANGRSFFVSLCVSSFQTNKIIQKFLKKIKLKDKLGFSVQALLVALTCFQSIPSIATFEAVTTSSSLASLPSLSFLPAQWPLQPHGHSTIIQTEQTHSCLQTLALAIASTWHCLTRHTYSSHLTFTKSPLTEDPNLCAQWQYLHMFVFVPLRWCSKNAC